MGQTDEFRLALDLASVAHERSDPWQSAADVVDCVRSMAPVLCVAVIAFDPVAREHVVLSSDGYSPAVLDYLQSPVFLYGDRGYVQLAGNTPRRVASWRDNGFDYLETYSAQEVFMPAGYAGGASARLTTRAGRYTGDLHISTATIDDPPTCMLKALQHVVSVLAAATDLTRRHHVLASGVGEWDESAVLASDGALIQLAPDDDNRYLLHDAALLGQLRHWLSVREDEEEERFHWCSPDGEWQLLRLVPTNGGVVVLLRGEVLPYGISRRELDVLTLLTEGYLNESIARRLALSERTVAHHIEHVLAKMNLSGRMLAARAAIKDGLRLLPGDVGGAGVRRKGQ